MVARIPTEWNQEKALAGVTNALQAHPDIGLIFTSSDFLLPSIASALKGAGRYRKAGEEGHVLLGGFDGDATAWRMLEEGTSTRPACRTSSSRREASIQAVLDLQGGQARAERDPRPRLRHPPGEQGRDGSPHVGRAGRPKEGRRSVRRAPRLPGRWGIALLSVVYLLALAPFVPGFLSAANLGDVLSNFLPLLAVSLGQTLVLVAGGIDLSVTATVALASVAGAKVMSESGGPSRETRPSAWRPCWR